MTAPAGALGEANYSVALVPGGDVNGSWRAGVLVKLKPEWKTYWRVPGDAGIPPQFDWSRSENVAEALVAFPLPTRFRDAGGEAIGYHNEVLFPVTVAPSKPQQNVVLNLDIFFAVCNDICIPARAQQSLDLSAAPPNSLVEMWQARVPVVVKDGPIKAASFVVDEGRMRTFLALRIDGKPDDIFVEGEMAGYFGKPEFDARRGAFLVPLSRLGKTDSLEKAKLKITLAMGASGIEQTIIVP